jgi:hypothetical protein
VPPLCLEEYGVQKSSQIGSSLGGSWKRTDQDPSPALRQGRNNLPQCVQILRVNDFAR